MSNHVIYKHPGGSETIFKLTAARAVELEERLGGSITEKIKEIDRLSAASEFIAAAEPDGEYRERREAALSVYDEMTEAGKTMQDYQFLIFDILVSAGFLDGKAVQAQKRLITAAQEAAEKRLAENLRALQN